MSGHWPSSLLTDQVGPQEVLSSRLLRDLRHEALRAHRKHSRPENGGGSLVDPDLDVIKKLAALVEEVGEVAQLLTYDRGVGRFGATNALEEWRGELRTELIQVANVAMTWAQSLNRDEVTP